jgi:hypothetical protein
LKIIYSGLIYCNSEGLTIEKSTLKRTSKPLTNGTVRFNNKFLNIAITMIGNNDPIIRSLYRDSENNELIWNCHHPKALAEICYNGNIYNGLGYAETLFSRINPVNLPIDELRWGRFLSDSYTLIWINWKDKYPLNIIFFNGIEYNDAIFENDNLVFGNGDYKLKFSEIQAIRNGRLSGLFSKMRILKILFNSNLLNSIEVKYKAKTILSHNSLILSNGWSLFEIVKWEK